MRVCLLINPGAGDGTSRADVCALIEREGHELVGVAEKDVTEVLDDTVQLVVAAGGDGTVARVAKSLAGRDVPMAVLPLGTANNIASSLGIGGTLRSMIARWGQASLKELDLGVIRGEWGESRFIEGVGAGLIPAVIAAMDAEPNRDEGADRALDRALGRHLEVLERAKARRLTLVIDGTAIDGDFLLAEVLNMDRVGPGLRLANNADPSDGRLSIVTAEEPDRFALAAYLRARLEGRDAELDLPVRHARRIHIDGLHEIHVDDELRHLSDRGAVSMEVLPASLRVLV